MKRFLIRSSILFAIASLTACASHHYTVVEPAKATLSSYSVLEIPEFTTSLVDEESRVLADRFAGRLHQAIREHRAKNPDKIVFDEVTLGTERSDGVLVMQGSVVSYEKGSRAKRYFIGFGAGKAYCTIQAVFIDKATGEELSRTNFDGELAMGLFGGDVDEAVDGVVRAFIDYMQDYMSS